MINLGVPAFSSQILHKERGKKADIRKLLKKQKTKNISRTDIQGSPSQKNQQEPNKKGFTSKHILMNFQNFQKKQRLPKFSKERIKTKNKKRKKMHIYLQRLQNQNNIRIVKSNIGVRILWRDSLKFKRNIVFNLQLYTQTNYYTNICVE